MTVIRAAHYAETEQRLEKDPHVRSIAWDLFNGKIAAASLVHEGTDTCRFEWTQRINGRYRELGGTDGGHIGAVPTATLALLRRMEAGIDPD